MPEFDFTSEIGNRYGRLLVLRFSRKGKAKRKYWMCRCDCGTEKEIASDSMRAGRAKSCGCLRREAKTTHGLHRSPTWNTWSQMLQRCTNRSCKSFEHYGGRGISVCDQWRHSFAVFFADMGEKPYALTIERINNDGNYEPGNCRWATSKEQHRNMRSNVTLTHEGRTLILQDWSALKGISGDVLRNRIRRGWTTQRALTAPIGPQGRHQHPRRPQNPITSSVI